MAKTEVTKQITKYIQDNKLQDTKDRRRILPNEPLQKLLQVTPEQEITYFTLHKFIKPHFIN